MFKYKLYANQNNTQQARSARDNKVLQPSCAAEYESVLTEQTTLITASDWQLDAVTRYTAGNGTLSLNAAGPDQFARTEPLGLESGALSVEIQVDKYMLADPGRPAHNWLTIGIGTELEADQFTTFRGGPHTVRF